MSKLELESSEARESFSPGERLKLMARWRLDEPAEAIELRLLWHTSGKGDADVSIVETIRFDQPSLTETREAEFQLPEAPYSFSGTLITLAWSVEMVALPANDSVKCDFTMAPGGHEVRLAPIDRKDANAEA